MNLLKNSCLVVLVIILNISCNKEQDNTTTNLLNSMLIGKTWYLDYSINGSNTKSYVGQTTYFITFFKNGTTKDSDGLSGTYSIKSLNGKYELYVEAKTVNGNILNYTHVIESVGSVNMVQSYIPFGQSTKITQYYTSK